MKTIYVDTSVFGGKFDEEFGYWTQIFLEQVIAETGVTPKSLKCFSMINEINFLYKNTNGN